MAKETLKIYNDSKNYTCQVIKLPPKMPVKGLDNLVEVNVQGNSVLVGKDSDENESYLFFPAECQISHEFLSKNNLYRHENLNHDPTKKGFFEDSRRVKAIKFKGIISSGFVIPLISSLRGVATEYDLKIGDEFNEFNGTEICRKYLKKISGEKGMSNPRAKVIDNIVDSKLAPEHPDTAQLMRNTHKLTLNTNITVTYKLHGTSARTYNTLVKQKLTWKDKLAKWFGVSVKEENYDYVVASRRTLKSVGFEELPGKNHYFVEGDLWSEVAKKEIEGKLNHGESIYYEIIGKTYGGEAIQGGYSYGFDGPQVYVYRIANINPQGIEIDLSYDQMIERATQMGLKTCPQFFKGTIKDFLVSNGEVPANDSDIEPMLSHIFYNKLLEKPSIFDPTVVEEGFCVRIDKYPKAETFKVKSKKFLAHESAALDKDVVDLEENPETNETTNN